MFENIKSAVVAYIKAGFVEEMRSIYISARLSDTQKSEYAEFLRARTAETYFKVLAATTPQALVSAIVVNYTGDYDDAEFDYVTPELVTFVFNKLASN